jgi:hypothetical protein
MTTPEQWREAVMAPWLEEEKSFEQQDAEHSADDMDSPERTRRPAPRTPTRRQT